MSGFRAAAVPMAAPAPGFAALNPGYSPDRQGV